MEYSISLHSPVRELEDMRASWQPVVSDDVALVRAVRQGDRDAFGELYKRYSRMVHGLLLARVPRDDAEDLVQEVFIAALQQIHTLRKDSAFPAWLAVIARNRANDHHRRTVSTVEVTEHLAGKGAPEVEALALLGVIRSLPEAYRESLILRLVEGMTGDEISARTGLKPGSVRVNLHRGMKILRDELEKGGARE